MALIKCSECGKEIEETNKFCPHCGFTEKKESAKVKNDNKNLEANKEKNQAAIKEDPKLNHKKTCKECGKKISRTEKVCPNCGIKIKKNKKITYIIIAIIIVIAAMVIFSSMKEKKYNDAITLFNNQEYDAALEKFSSIENYNYSSYYITAIEAVQLLEEKKYSEALDKLETIPVESIDNGSQLIRYAQLGVDYEAKEYDKIYEEYKYTSTYYNDNEEILVKDAIYNYGVERYKGGYYTTAKEILGKVKGYKDTDEILKDKYFDLIGNYYSYSVSYGYQWGLVSLMFYSTGDKLIYNVFTQSLFDTNIPSGYDYDYKIVNDTLYIGSGITYKITSFDGNKLIIRDGNISFTLEKQ